MIGFGQENRHILHCLFRFKITFWSRVVLGCCETSAKTSTKSLSAINQVLERDVIAMGVQNVRLSRAF